METTGAVGRFKHFNRLLQRAEITTFPGERGKQSLNLRRRKNAVPLYLIAVHIKTGDIFCRSGAAKRKSENGEDGYFAEEVHGSSRKTIHFNMFQLF
jgi:hypothetical protein